MKVKDLKNMNVKEMKNLKIKDLENKGKSAVVETTTDKNKTNSLE